MDARIVADFAQLKKCLLILESELTDVYEASWVGERVTEWRNAVSDAATVKELGQLLVDFTLHIKSMNLGHTLYNEPRWRGRTLAGEKVEDLAPVLGILGRSAQWQHLNPKWREEERSIWLGKVNALACGLELGPYIVTFETGIQWSAVRASWRDARDPWTRDVMNATSVPDVLRLFLELVDVLRETAFVEHEKAQYTAWLEQVNATWTESEAAHLILRFKKEFLSEQVLSGYFALYGHLSWTRGLHQICCQVPSLLTLSVQALVMHGRAIPKHLWEMLPTELQDYALRAGCKAEGLRTEPESWRHAYYATEEIQFVKTLEAILSAKKDAREEDEKAHLDQRLIEVIRKRKTYLDASDPGNQDYQWPLHPME